MSKFFSLFSLQHRFWLFATFLLAFLFDQATKNYFYFYFMFNESINMASFFSLTFVWNTGMSFSMFSSQPVLFNILLSSFALVVILFVLFKHFKTNSIYFAVAVGFVTAGSLGNIVDRLRFSAVIDFLHFYYKGYSFPVFNFADVFINFALVLIFFDQYISNKKG